VNEKEYQIDYVLKNPPAYAKKYKTVWQQAFTEYLERQGVDIKKVSKVDNIEWNEVIRIFNTLLGVKNRKRPDNFKKKKNDKLVAEDVLEVLSLIEGLGELKAFNSYYKVVRRK